MIEGAIVALLILLALFSFLPMQLPPDSPARRRYKLDLAEAPDYACQAIESTFFTGPVPVQGVRTLTGSMHGRAELLDREDGYKLRWADGRLSDLLVHTGAALVTICEPKAT